MSTDDVAGERDGEREFGARLVFDNDDGETTVRRRRVVGDAEDCTNCGGDAYIQYVNLDQEEDGWWCEDCEATEVDR